MKYSKLSLMLLLPLFGVHAQAPVKANPGIDYSLMDTSVAPGDDFFRYVNGKWFDNTELPADRTRWGSFDELGHNTSNDALNILKDAVNKGYAATTDQGKAVGFYQTIMDTISRNKLGYQPLQPYFKKVDAVKDAKTLSALITEMQPIGGVGFLGVYIGPDAKDSNRNIVTVSPGSVGLPDRDYYVGTDANSQEKRDKYVAHLTKMFQMIGQKEKEAKTNAEKILALELQMSEPRFTRVEQRDSRNTYNMMTITELQKLIPNFDVVGYFKGIGLGNVEKVNVSQPKYIKALNDILGKKDVATWKAYMKWTLLNRYASSLSTTLEDANWEFYGKTLTGAIKQRPRDERAMQNVNRAIGEAVGKLYVAEKFPPQAKEKCKEMVEYLFRAYEKRIKELPWMDQKTKEMAIQKLNKINVKIGYPDKWKDYSALALKGPNDGATFFSNTIESSRWRYAENLEELNKPVDKSRWGMTPQTVNAYYSPSFNEIVFPAGILQPPFYNYKADEAVNFGGIGAVIGHEISHGFDDSGARYDANGNLEDWWTATDLEKFTELGSALSAQYSKLQPLPGTFVDGKFTLGENIGDLGGVNAAYDGLQLFLKEKGNPGLIDGYSPEQRFFISWATIWRSKSRDEYVKNQVKTDPHAPAYYRAYVPLQNVDEFYKAFDIKSTNKLYLDPKERVKIW